MLIAHVPDVRWAVCGAGAAGGVHQCLCGQCGHRADGGSGRALPSPGELKLSPVPVLIAIAVSSNLQGAATLVGDTTSILLGSFADMNFFDFFWMRGPPGHLLERGAGRAGLAGGAAVAVPATRRQPVTMPRWRRRWRTTCPPRLMLLTVGLLIAASFLPEPCWRRAARCSMTLRSGLVCMGLCLVRRCARLPGAAAPCKAAGPRRSGRWTVTPCCCCSACSFVHGRACAAAGVIDAAAAAVPLRQPETSRCHLYLLLVAVSVGAVGLHRQHPLCGGHAAGGAGRRRPHERRRGH